MKEALPLVSVIIPTWNSCRTLELCLRSIIHQRYKNIEVVVVDGGSVDNTLEILQKYKVNVVKSRKHSRTLQRNMGVLNARGELLLLIDSDEILHPMLIDECVNKFLSLKFDALFIPTVDTGFSYLGKSRYVGDYINLMLRKEIFIPNSALRFFTRKVFEITGGQDEDLLFGEDVIFALKCIKHGFRIGRCKSVIFHYATEGLKNIFIKKYIYGKTYSKAKKRYKNLCLSSPNIRHINTGLFYLRHIFKFQKLSRYIPGFLTVKLVERLGIILGSGIFEYFF